MIVVSRKRDEAMLVGDQIVVTVIEIRGDKVRLGIQAPADVPIHRKEVYDSIVHHNEAAVVQPPLPIPRTAVSPPTFTTPPIPVPQTIVIQRPPLPSPRLDPQRPLESLKQALSATLSPEAFASITGILDQLESTSGIAIRQP